MTAKETIEHAFLLRCCAKAICRLERAGLKRDAQAIRDELKTMGILVDIMPDPTDQKN